MFSLKSITEANEKHKLDYEKLNQAYTASQISLQQNTMDYPQMEKAYQFYQKCRAYVYSFLECYNEKVFKSSTNFTIYSFVIRFFFERCQF